MVNNAAAEAVRVEELGFIELQSMAKRERFQVTYREFCEIVRYMDEWQKKKLLGQICDGSDFARSDNLTARDILWYLAEHPGPAGREARSKPHLEKVVREARKNAPAEINIPLIIKRMQEGLDRFFRKEGAHLEHRVEVRRAPSAGRSVPDQYDLHFYSRFDELARKFWDPHLSDLIGTLIVYGEPLFWRTTGDVTSERVYVRKSTSNSQIAGAAATEIKVKDLGPGLLKQTTEASKLERGLLPCYPFLTTGEINATFLLLDWLTKNGVPVHRQGARHDSNLSAVLGDDRPEHQSLILVGTPRSNGIVAKYQKYPKFCAKLTESAVVIQGQQDQPDQDDEHNPDTIHAYVLVSRRRGYRNQWISMITSNQGCALERVTKILTSGNLTDEVLLGSPLTQEFDRKVPEEFQIVFQVDVHDNGTVAGATRVEWSRDCTSSVPETNSN